MQGKEKFKMLVHLFKKYKQKQHVKKPMNIFIKYRFF